MGESTKLLRRLPRQGQVAGVCAGVAEYMGVDVTLVRVVFIILTFITSGGFILVYILLAIVIPSVGGEKSATSTDLAQNVKVLADDMREVNQQHRLRNYAGVGLIALGTWLFLGQMYPGWINATWNYLWPIALILLGAFIATRRSKR